MYKSQTIYEIHPDDPHFSVSESPMAKNRPDPQFARGPNAKSTLVTGGTGFVGASLVKRLDHVSLITRPGSNANSKFGDCVDQIIEWNSASEPIDLTGYGRFETVVNLMGEPIAEGRWTQQKKDRIRDSRVEGTRKLAHALIDTGKLPSVFVSGSAVGIYGDSGERIVEEEHEQGTDFLAQVCQDWESACRPLSDLGVRVVHLRIGIVLGQRGGVLQKLVPVFRRYLGGRLGSGEQWMSWIHLQDLVSLILWAIETDSISGPVNATAPNPVRNVDFTKALAIAVRRPAIIPAPRFPVRLALGEFAESLFYSQRVIPSVALANGFQFQFAALQVAINNIVDLSKAYELDLQGSTSAART